MWSFGMLSHIVRTVLTSVLSSLPITLRGMQLENACITIENGAVTIIIDRLFAILETTPNTAVAHPPESPPSQHEASSQQPPPSDEPASLPTGALVRILERAVFSLAKRIAVRITNLHLRVEGSSKDTVAGITLQELSLGGETLMLPFCFRGAAEEAARSPRATPDDLTLRMKVSKLAAYVDAKRKVQPEVLSKVPPSSPSSEALSGDPAKWSQAQWLSEMLPLVHCNYERPEHLLLPLSLHLDVGVKLGKQALHGYQVNVRLGMPSGLLVRVAPTQLERLMGLIEEILRACTPGSDEQAQADSPGALTEAITATTISAPAATPAATPATNATTRPLEQRMACDLAELDPLAWIRAAGVPPLASASIVIERLEVSLLGETTHASQPGDASSSSLQPAADERKPLPFISSERILVAVLEEVDAIRLTYHLVEKQSHPSSPDPLSTSDPSSPPAAYGFLPGAQAAMYLTVALPGRLCLCLSQCEVPRDGSAPPFVAVSLTKIVAAIAIGSDGMDIQAKVGSARVEIAVSAMVTKQDAASSDGMLLITNGQESHENLAPPNSAQQTTLRVLCLLETGDADGSGDWLTARLKMLDPTSKLLSHAATTPEAMMTIDGLVGPFTLHASHGLVDHFVSITTEILTSVVDHLPPSLQPQNQPPPPPDPPPDVAPPLPPMMLRLQIQKIALHVYTIGDKLIAHDIYATNGLGGYEASELVCSLELHAADLEIALGVSTMDLELQVADLELLAPPSGPEEEQEAAKMIQELFRDRLFAKLQQRQRKVRKRTMLEANGILGLFARRHKRKLLWRLGADEVADAARPDGTPKTLAVKDVLSSAFQGVRTQARPIFKMEIHGREPSSPSLIMESLGELNLNIRHLGIILHPEVVSRLLTAVFGTLKSLEPWIAEQIDPAAPAPTEPITALSCLNLVVDGAVIVVPSPAEPDGQLRPGAYVLNLGRFAMKNGFKEAPEEVAPQQEIAEPVLFPAQERSNTIIATMAMQLAPSAILMSPNFRSDTARTTGWILRSNLRSLTPSGLALNLSILKRHTCRPWEMDNYVETLSSTEIVATLAPLALELQLDGTARALKAVDSVMMVLDALPQDEIPFCSPQDQIMKQIIRVHFAPWDGDRLEMHQQVAKDRAISGLHVVLYDGFLPIVEVALSELNVSAELEVLQPSLIGFEIDPVKEPLRGGNASVFVGLRVMAYNEALEAWEPLVEPWTVHLKWSAKCVCGGSIAAPGNVQQTPSTDLVPAVDIKPVIGHAIHLQSTEPLELNVSHAMLVSALQTLTILLTLEEEDQESNQDLVKRHHRGCVHNLTELFIKYEVVSTSNDEPAGRVVAPGELRSFPSPNGSSAPPAPPSSMGTMKPARGNTTHQEMAACSNCFELVDAVKKGDTAMATELLQRTAPVESTDRQGSPVLHLAINRRDEQMVSLLLLWKANVDAPAPISGNRPLHLSASRNSLECTQALLNARANPSATNAKGQVPPRVAIPGSKVQKEIYNAMIEKINAEGRRFSSFKLVNEVVPSADVGQIRELLEQKADPNSTDGHVTALQKVVQLSGEQATTTAAVLIDGGADLEYTKDTNNNGRTALALAAEAGNVVLVQFLLERGASACTLDESFQLPLDLCCHSGATAAQVRKSLREALHDELILAGWLGVESSSTVASPAGSSLLGTSSSSTPRRKSRLSLRRSSSAHAEANTSRTRVQRFCALLPTGWLVCFGDEELTRSFERVPLESMLAVSAVEDDDDNVGFQLDCPGATYAFYCEEFKETRDEWLQTLREESMLLQNSKSDGPLNSAPSRLKENRRKAGRRISLSRALPVPKLQALRRSFVPSQAVQPMLSSANSSRGARQTADEVELRLSVDAQASEVRFANDSSTCARYGPLEHVSMRIGTSLMKMVEQSDPSKSVGVLLSVTARRGVRTLTVASPVLLTNSMAAQLQVNFAQSTATESEISMAPKQTCSIPLFDIQKCGGSWPTCEALKVRPGQDWEGGQLDFFGSAASTASRSSFISDAARKLFQMNSAGTSWLRGGLIMSQRRPVSADDLSSGGNIPSTWFCCVDVTSPDAIISDTWQAERREAALNLIAEHGGQQQEEILPGFRPTKLLEKLLSSQRGLPSADSLLNGWTCSLQDAQSFSGQMTGWIGVTHSECVFFSASRRQSIANAQPISKAWNQLELTRSRDPSLPSFILTISATGQAFEVSGMVNFEATFRILTNLKAAYDAEWKEGPGRWLPRQVAFYAPLTFTNLMPSQLQLTVKRVEANGDHDSAREATFDVTLRPGQSIACTELHALTRLQLTAELASARADEPSLVGSAELHCESILEQVVEEAGSLPDDAAVHSSLMIDLKPKRSGRRLTRQASAFVSLGVNLPVLGSTLKMKASATVRRMGTLSIDFEAPHALQNLTAFSLNLYSPADPSQGAVSERVAQSRAGQVNLSLFSLRGRLDKAQLSIWREESSKGSLRRSATRALADMSDTTKAAAASTIGKFWKSRGSAGFRLSKAFSVVEVGTDRVLQLVGEGGKVHDVAIQIEKLAGKLAASTTVVVVRDAFVLHNLTGMTLQWRSSAGTNLMDADAEMPIYWSKNTSSASNSADANEDGTLDASIDVVTDRRKLCVRVNLGGREWSSWSRPFDAESATSCELKLRSRMLGTEIRHRLQLAVTTERAVRRLSISALAPTVPRPYLVQNSSSCLLAYRQNGTHFWDFLGAHESRAYSWDDAQAKEKQLEVIAWDPVDGLVGQLHHVTIAKPKAIRLPMSEKEAKIDLASPISRIASFSAAAACVIRYGGDSADRAVGWLCMSQDALHLVVARNALGTAEAAKDDRSDAAAEKGEMQLGASAQVDSPTSPLNNAIWAGRSRIMQPIPFSIIENVSLRGASQCISLCLASDDRGVEVKLELGELLDAAETMSKLENMRRAALEGETPAPSSADAMQHTPESRPTASLPATTPARRSSVPFLSPRANSRSSTPRESSAQQASGGPAAGKFRSLMMTPRKRWMKLEAKPRGPLRVLELREDDGSVKATPASRRRRASQEPGSSSMRSLRLQLSPRRSLAGSDAEQHHEQEVDDEEDVVVTEELESEHEVLRTAEQGEEPELLRVVVSLPRIGLSLVDEEPVEVLCASLIGIDATYVMQDLDLDGELEHKVDFTLQRLQVDSALTDTQFKVMLAPDPHGGLTGNQGAPGKLETPRAPGKGFAEQQLSPSDLPESPGHLSTSSQGGEGKQPGQKEQEKPCLSIKIGRLHQWANVLCISKATVSLVPLVLQLEQNVLARILRMVDSLAPLLDDLGAVQERLARSQEYVDKEVSVRGSGGDSAAPSGPDASDEQVGIGASELLLQEVKLDNISLNISVVWDAFCAPSFLQPYHPSKMLLHVSERLSSFAVHGWKLKLPKLNMPEGFETTDSLVLRVVWHYLAPLLRASYRLLLVASPLGAAVQDVKGGTIALVKAPKEAMRKDRSRTANAIAVASSLRKGSVSLAAAVPAFMLDASASVCHSAETFCGAFSLDSKQSSKESLNAQGTPNNTLQGIAQGTTLVYDGAARGVRDLMKVPMERAKRSKSRTGKAIGFSTGIVKGVAGLVGAPTAAAFGAAAKTCEGLSSDLRRHTHEGQQRDARRKMLRVRQPRKMGHKSVLRTYPRLDASLEHGDHTHSWVESTMTREEESHMLLIQELPELVSGGKQTKARGFMEPEWSVL